MACWLQLDKGLGMTEPVKAALELRRRSNSRPAGKAACHARRRDSKLGLFA